MRAKREGLLDHALAALASALGVARVPWMVTGGIAVNTAADRPCRRIRARVPGAPLASPAQWRRYRSFLRMDGLRSGGDRSEHPSHLRRHLAPDGSRRRSGHLQGHSGSSAGRRGRAGAHADAPRHRPWASSPATRGASGAGQRARDRGEARAVDCARARGSLRCAHPVVCAGAVLETGPATTTGTSHEIARVPLAPLPPTEVRLA
jgi:hypothetical protein